MRLKLLCSSDDETLDILMEKKEIAGNMGLSI